jgi:hypothetical protein
MNETQPKRKVPHQSWELVFEFQVHWPGGPERGKYFEAASAEEAEERCRTVEQLGPDVIVSVGPGRPIMDWNMPVFDMHGAALFAKCSYSQISTWMAQGKLPKAKEGKPRFYRRDLERVIDGCMEGTK